MNYIIKWNTNTERWFIRGLKPNGHFYGEVTRGNKITDIKGCLPQKLIALLRCYLHNISQSKTKSNPWTAMVATGTVNEPNIVMTCAEGDPIMSDFLKLMKLISQSQIVHSASMNTYKGTFTNDEKWYHVTVNDKPFSAKESLKHVQHSPDGFSWGYNGSGPAQLAFAILLNETGDVLFSLELYQFFKEDVIAKIPQESSFVLTSNEIESAIDKIMSRLGPQWAQKVLDGPRFGKLSELRLTDESVRCLMNIYRPMIANRPIYKGQK